MRPRLFFAAAMLAVLGGSGSVWMLAVPEAQAAVEAPVVVAPQLDDPVARGAYLALAANCRGCHTADRTQPYAGGRRIPTPFGDFFGPNLTPDVDTGLGAWSADDFWRALHEGRGREGEALYPVFPYTHYTRLSRRDADDLFAYLQSLPAVRHDVPAHALRFPYGLRPLMRIWQALFFRPGGFEPEPGQDARWNQGAYLVEALGHCGGCHVPRNALGGSKDPTSPVGGVVLDWYAPSLASSTEAGVMAWSQEDTVQWLASGRNAHASALGPMAEVIYESLQHLSGDDLDAMAHYLRQQPDQAVARRVRPLDASSPVYERGSETYRTHCADCHGVNGQGQPPAAPALAGNRAVTLGDPANLIRVLLYGGYPPGTAGNPQPFGMPPYHGTLSNAEIADLLSYLRAAWGNQAGPVRDFEVAGQRTGPLW